MVANFRQLAKNHRFLIKLIEIAFAIIGFGLLCHEESYVVPRWLWLIYCTDTLTYAIILITLAGSYIFEENCVLLDTTVSVIGVPLYITAGLSAVIRWELYIPKDVQQDCCEIVLGICFILIAALMIGQVIWSMYARNQRVQEYE